jgi:hypothetical protein
MKIKIKERSRIAYKCRSLGHLNKEKNNSTWGRLGRQVGETRVTEAAEEGKRTFFGREEKRAEGKEI